MKLSLVISTYNQPAALTKVLQGVARQSRAPDEILLADDGSGESTRELIDHWRKRRGRDTKYIPRCLASS